MTIDTDEWMLPHHDSLLVTFQNKEGVTLGHKKVNSMKFSFCLKALLCARTQRVRKLNVSDPSSVQNDM